MPKFTRRLSIASLDKWLKDLEQKKSSYTKVAVRIADRLADIMMDCDLQSETYKVPAKLKGKVAQAGIKNDTPKATFQEFGTCVI